MSTDAKYFKFINSIDEYIIKYSKWYNIPGVAISVINNWKVFWMNCYGSTGKRKIKPNTCFNVASISKTITAWGIMKMVDDKIIELDDPVEKFLTKWHIPESCFNQNEVTFRHLLSHTSGLNNLRYLGYKPKCKIPSIEESLSGIYKDSGVYFIQIPGAGFNYSGVNYSVLQLLIEEITGMTFSLYMKEKILSPLGMENSTFDLKEERQLDVSSGYNLLGKKVPSYIYSEKAAAGFYTCITDLSKFLIANITNPNLESSMMSILRPETLLLMQTRVQRMIPYGLGFSIISLPKNNKVVMHSGMNIGWHSHFAILPKNGNAIVVMTNSNNGINLCNDIMNMWINLETDYVMESLRTPNKIEKIDNFIKCIYYQYRHKRVVSTLPGSFNQFK